ncbi:MAG TPA: TetR/AcrR family transcriptional regulator [Spirochaetia bacterium]
MPRNHRNTLLRIAERLFTEHGYRAVSIRDITTEAGLGMGSFYTYFPGKEAIYGEVLDAIESRGLGEVEKRVRSLHSPLFQLKALFRYTALALRNNAILRGIYAGEKRYLYPGLEERSRRPTTLFTRIEEMTREILAEGAVRGTFRTSLFHDPTRMLVAIFGAVSLYDHGAAADELTDDVVTLVERGMKRWLRFRQRDERLDSRARRRAGPGSLAT